MMDHSFCNSRLGLSLVFLMITHWFAKRKSPLQGRAGQSVEKSQPLLLKQLEDL